MTWQHLRPLLSLFALAVIASTTAAASPNSAHETLPSAAWSTLNQLNVTTILETAMSPSFPATTGPFVAVVFSALVAQTRMAPPAQHSVHRFAQRLAFIDAPRGPGPAAQHQRVDVDAMFATVTAFCERSGDCSTAQWCAVSGGDAEAGNDVATRRLRFTFLSAGTDDGTVRIWYSDPGQDGSYLAPMPLLGNKTPPQPWQRADVAYYAATDDGATYAFTYGRRRATNATVREVVDDVLIDVIDNAATVVQNVLCTVHLLGTTTGAAAAAVKCLDYESSVGMAAWMVSCWSHPSQFSFQPLNGTAPPTLAFTHTRTLRANDWADSENGTTKMGISTLTVTPTGPDEISWHGWVTDERLLFQPIWSRDTEYMAFAVLRPQSEYYLWSQVWLICVRSPKDLFPTRCDSVGSQDQEPNLIGFMPDNTGIIYTEQHGTRVTLNMMSIPGSKGPFKHVEMVLTTADEHDVIPQVVSCVSMDTSSGKSGMISFVGEAPLSPPEVWVGYLKAGDDHVTVKRVSELNAAAAAQALNVAHEVVTWGSLSGDDNISGILLQPAPSAGRNGGGNDVTGRPLIVFPHPGPNMAHAETYLGWGGVGARYPVATLAQLGYGVLMPNIRGSAGYGAKFRTDIYQDWGGIDLADLFDGVRSVAASHNFDLSNVHMFGWSYGGYLSAMALTQASARFNITPASFCIGGGLVDLISHTGTADIAKILRNTYGGYYWEKSNDTATKTLFEKYEKSSAMFSINGAKAPTLFHHGAHDPRMPILQAFQLHYALRAKAIDTRMLVYPGSGHIPGDAEQLLSVWDSTIEWLTAHTPH